MSGLELAGGDSHGANGGLRTTFQVLARAENEAAVRTLVSALDSPYPVIRDSALEALLLRRSPAGHREIVRRLDSLGERSGRIVAAHVGRMVPTLREAVLTDDLALCRNACRAAISYRQYELIPALIPALENAVGATSDMAAKTFLELAEMLSVDLAAPPAPGGRDLAMVRDQVLRSLEASVKRFARHRRREPLETLVLLADRENPLLLLVLHDVHHSAFPVLMEILSKSTSGGALRLLLSFLDDPQVPSVVLSVISKRCDREFFQSLLRKTGREPSLAVTQNLKRIESWAWLANVVLLDDLDELGQHAAVQLLTASGVSRSQLLAPLGHLLLAGNVGGRRAAAQALDAFPGAEANDLVARAADDEDPQVQAHLLLQLRRRGIPGALLRVMQMVDSPHALVRRAARKALSEFNFPRFLAAFDLLDDEVRRSSGALVKKVDPNAMPMLKAEMESKVCKRRLRALAMARAMGAVTELEPMIIELLEDEDHSVRAEAAFTLAESPTAAAREALAELLTDRNQAVQEAARRSLEQT
jgi:HEAT repeat protein